MHLTYPAEEMTQQLRLRALFLQQQSSEPRTKSDSSQQPVTPAPVNPLPSSGDLRHLLPGAHTHQILTIQENLYSISHHKGLVKQTTNKLSCFCEIVQQVLNIRQTIKCCEIQTQIQGNAGILVGYPGLELSVLARRLQRHLMMHLLHLWN